MSLMDATADIDLDTRMVRGIEASFVLRDRKSPIHGQWTSAGKNMRATKPQRTTQT